MTGYTHTLSLTSTVTRVEFMSYAVRLGCIRSWACKKESGQRTLRTKVASGWGVPNTTLTWLANYLTTVIFRAIKLSKSDLKRCSIIANMRAASSVGLCPSHFAVKIAKTIQLTFSHHKISLMLCTGNHILIHIRVPSYMMCENIITSDKEGGKCVCPRSFVCLSVCVQDYSKARAWIWMKCCVSTDIGT